MSDTEGNLKYLLIHVPKNERHAQLIEKVLVKHMLNSRYI